MSLNSWKNTISSTLSEHKFLFSHLWRLLKWEKPFFPIITFLSLTIFFWILSMFKMSALSTFAIIGITGTLIDLAGPSVYPSLEQTLGSPRASDYDEFCNFLSLPFKAFEQGVDRLKDLRNRQKVYVSCLIAGGLIVISLLGRVNNLYLAYLACLIYLMAPGVMKMAGISLESSGLSSSPGFGSGSSPGSPLNRTESLNKDISPSPTPSIQTSSDISKDKEDSD